MKFILSFSTFIFLTGCATSYQPQGMTGGFSEVQLEANVFKVSFNGNGYTRADTASDYALLRSAELARQNGYKYFVIVDTANTSETSSFTTPTTAVTNVNANTYGNAYSYGNSTNYRATTYGTATTTVYGGHTYNISKPQSTNTIICFNDKPEGFAYNVDFVIKSIKDKHGIK